MFLIVLVFFQFFFFFLHWFVVFKRLSSRCIYFTQFVFFFVFVFVKFHIHGVLVWKIHALHACIEHNQMLFESIVFVVLSSFCRCYTVFNIFIFYSFFVVFAFTSQANVFSIGMLFSYFFFSFLFSLHLLLLLFLDHFHAYIHIAFGIPHHTGCCTILHFFQYIIY